MVNYLPLRMSPGRLGKDGGDVFNFLHPVTAQRYNTKTDNGGGHGRC